MNFDEEFNTPNCPEESYTGHEYEHPRDPDYVSKKKKGLFRFAKGALAFQVGAAAVVLSVVSSESFAKDALDPSRFIIVSDAPVEAEPLIVVSDKGEDTVYVDNSDGQVEVTDNTDITEPADDTSVDIIEAIDDLVKPSTDNKTTDTPKPSDDIKTANQVTVSICSDAIEEGISPESDVFYSNKLTITRLYDMAIAEKIEIDQPVRMSELHRF